MDIFREAAYSGGPFWIVLTEDGVGVNTVTHLQAFYLCAYFHDLTDHLMAKFKAFKNIDRITVVLVSCNIAAADTGSQVLDNDVIFSTCRQRDLLQSDIAGAVVNKTFHNIASYF